MSDGPRKYGGDTKLLATVSANGDGLRDRAQVHFNLTEPAQVTLDVQRTTASIDSIYTRTWTFRAGSHTIAWTPAKGIAARTYILSLTTQDPASNVLTYGAPEPHVERYPAAPVVRVIGVDATFTKQSYLPGAQAALRISADVPKLQAQVFQSGPEHEVTYADYLLAGIPITDPVDIDWERRRDEANTVTFQIGNWPSGFYFVKLTQPDGSFGYAPFIIRPRRARRDVAGRGRPADEHLAGLQLLRRGRRRLGRLLVRRAAPPRGAARPPVPPPRRAAVLLPLRPGLPALALLERQAGRVPLRHGRPDALRRRPRKGVRPDRLPGPQRVRDDGRVRRDRALPQPRRQPDLPLREQLLLEGDRARATCSRGLQCGATSAAPRRR